MGRGGYGQWALNQQGVGGVGSTQLRSDFEATPYGIRHMGSDFEALHHTWDHHLSIPMKPYLHILTGCLQ